MSTKLSHSNSPLSRYIEKNRSLCDLIAAAPSLQGSCLQVVQLATNETIYDEGDRVNHIYFPLDSVVSSIAVFSDRSTVEIAMFGNESILGVSNVVGSRVNQYPMRMCIGGHLAKLDIENLGVAFSESKKVAKIILQSYATLVTQISQRSVCHARHSVMERFCCWLLMINDRSNQRSLRLTQELVAGRLGTRRAGITVAARMLLSEDAVEYRRGLLRIKDRERVEQHACECYSVMKLASQTVSEQAMATQPVRTVVLPLNRSQRFVPSRINRA